MSERYTNEVISKAHHIRLDIVDLNLQIADLRAELRNSSPNIVRAMVELAAPLLDDERARAFYTWYWVYEMHRECRDAYKALTGKQYKPSMAISEQCCKCETWFSVIFASATEFMAQSGNLMCAVCTAEEKRRYDAMFQPDPKREARIEELRTMPYAEYLQSPEWITRRGSMLRRAGFRCQLCNAGGQLNVHHRTYQNRGNEPYSDLIVLCQPCHAKFHNKEQA